MGIAFILTTRPISCQLIWLYEIQIEFFEAIEHIPLKQYSYNNISGNARYKKIKSTFLLAPYQEKYITLYLHTFELLLLKLMRTRAQCYTTLNYAQ